MKQMYIGAAYYPELWDEAEIDRDIEQMKAHGMNVMRIGEFAWSKMEPREGEFDMSLFRRVMDKLYENGIYTILCTPSCTPPRWLFDKYPDALRVICNGTYSFERQEVHSRCHPCKTSPDVREKNRIIARVMAKELGHHPGLIGWQIDNELFVAWEGCFCDRCVAHFRERLKKKFGTIDALNAAWHMDRWSLEYASFDKVLPPRCGRWDHPSLMIEWVQFQNDLLFSYAADQADAIREYSDAPIGTDMMTNNLVSYEKMNERLDIIQYNHYESKEDLWKTPFAYGFLRTLKDRPFWVTETMVGWNGSVGAWNGKRPEGACYMNTVAPVAFGGEMNMYWLFRAHPAGHELGHGAVLSSAGRPYRISQEIKWASDDLAKCSDFLSGSRANSRIALHYSSNSYNAFRFEPLRENMDYRSTLIDQFYSKLRHHNPDLIDTGHTLDGYDVVISPFLAYAQENGLKERILAWVEKGGRWIVGPMTDILDENSVKYTTAPFSFLEEAAGVYTKYQNPLPCDDLAAKWTDGSACGVSFYADAFEAKDAEVLATYTDCEFDGLAAITRRKLGKGEIILLGAVPDKEALLRLIGIPAVAPASNNVSLVRRHGKENGIIALEMEHKAGYVELDKPYYDILGERTVSGRVELKPYEALFLKEI